MYLLVKATGKYWRMDYRHADKRKTLALGVHPTVTLAQARKKRDTARELLAQGIDPGVIRRAEKVATKVAAENTFEAIARELHAIKAASWSPLYGVRWLERMEKDLFEVRRTLAGEDTPQKNMAACSTRSMPCIPLPPRANSTFCPMKAMHVRRN